MVSILIIVMAEWLSLYDLLLERIDLGSIVLTPKDYPVTTFLMGCLFQKIPQIESLFELFQVLTMLRKRKLLALSLFKQILQLLYQDPYLLSLTLSALLRIKDQNADPQKEFQRLHRLKSVRSINEAMSVRSINEAINARSIDEAMSVRSINEAINARGINEAINARGTNEAMSKLASPKEALSKQVAVSTVPPSNTKLQRTKTVQYEQTPILQESFVDNEQEHRLQEKNDQQFARKIQEQELNELNEQKQQCEICLQDLYCSPSQPMQNCSHIFHTQCLLQSFKTAILSNIFPLRCLSCPTQVTSGEIRRILPPEWHQKYTDNTLKYYAELHGDSVSWCPTADCKYLFFFQKQDGTQFQCEDCKKSYCLECRVEWHDKMTCKEYQITHTKTEDDEKFLSFVKGKKFKQCPKCKYWVEKNSGCDHMTCKCTFQFCYKCGGVYMKCDCVEKQRLSMERRRLANNAKMNKKTAMKKELASRASKGKGI